MKIIIGLIIGLALGWGIWGTDRFDSILDRIMPGGGGEEETATVVNTDEETATTTSVPQTVVFTLTGKNFEFSQTELRVKKGDTVTINFFSTDGMHDFVIDELNATTSQVRPGATTTVTFVADQAGEFEYYCSVGNHHAQGMEGTLIVEDTAMGGAAGTVEEGTGEDAGAAE